MYPGHATRVLMRPHSAALAALLCFLCVSGSVAFDAKMGLLMRISTPSGAFVSRFWAQVAACSVMAIKHMNDRNTEIVAEAANLPADFNVSYVMKDSFTNPSIAVKKANEMMGENVHAIVGPLLSASAGPVSLMAGIDRIPVMAFASTAPSLSDKTTYPYFGRTVLSDSKLTSVIIDTCKRIGWKNMAVLYQDDTWGSGLAEAINSAAAELDVKILTSQKFRNSDVESMKSALHAAASYGGRVFLFAVMEFALDDFFFAAEDAGITGRGYSWVNTGGVEDPSGVVAASADPGRFQRLISGVLDVRDFALYGELGPRLAASLAKIDPEELYNPVMGPRDIVISAMRDAPSNQCGYIYDATWVQGLAMSRAGLTADGQLDREQQLYHMRNLEFRGATGRVKMNPETGDRLSDSITMIVKNWQPSLTAEGAPSVQSVLVSLYDAASEGLDPVAEPYWGGGVTGWDDVPGDGFQCEAGFFENQATFECEPCPLGTEQIGAYCSPCGLGRHADQVATIACPRCGEGYANETGLATCYSCPTNSYRPAGTQGVSISECICEPGTFSRYGPGSACEACPAGAVCTGGVSPPYPLAGFWGDKECTVFGGTQECENAFEFLECKGNDCDGGPDFECKEGRTGRMCMETVDGWYNVGGIEYLKCADGGTALAFLAILCVVFTWAFLLVASDRYVSIDVLIKFMSVNAMVTTYGFKWHSNMNAMNVFLRIANFDIDFVSPGCFGSWKPIHSYLSQLMLPFVVTFLYVVALSIYHQIRRSSPAHGLHTIASKLSMSLSISVYHTLVYKSFANFNCERFPNGRLYLLYEPAMECWKGAHVAMVVMGVLYLVFVAIGLPAFLWYTVRKHRREGSLRDTKIQYLYGWLHEHYKMHYKNWILVVCTRRFIVSLIAAVVPWSMLQGILTVVVIMALLVAQVLCHPHHSYRIDLLEFISLCQTVLYVLGGMLMYAPITSQAQGRICTGDAPGDPFCAEDIDIKYKIAVFTLLAMALTLFSMGILVFTRVWDQRNSAKAASLLGKYHKQVHGRPPTPSVLGHILNSMAVLRWAKQPTFASPSRIENGRGAALKQVEFEALERGLENLSQHFSSAKSVRADILQKVCGIPGLLEWIVVEREGRESMLRFVNGFADFLRKEKRFVHAMRSNTQSSGDMQQAASAAVLSTQGSFADFTTMPTQPTQRLSAAPARARGRKNSLIMSVSEISNTLPLRGNDDKTEQAMPTFPISDMVKKEHTAMAVYYMLTCSREERKWLCNLFDSILKVTYPGIGTIQKYQRSSSISSSAGKTAALLRETSDAGHKTLSLDDYVAPPVLPGIGNSAITRHDMNRSDEYADARFAETSTATGSVSASMAQLFIPGATNDPPGVNIDPVTSAPRFLEPVPRVTALHPHPFTDTITDETDTESQMRTARPCDSDDGEYAQPAI